jgi:fatty-acyl-CoA synthase
MATNDRQGTSATHAWVRALELTAPIAANPQVTLPVLVDRLAEKFGAAPALLGDTETLTYRELAERSNRYARWALEQGIRAGDVVCLIMANCPDYLAVWLGVTRTGAIVALINTNLVGDSLAHVINVVAPRHVVLGAELCGAVAAIASKLAPHVRCWVHGADDGSWPRIDTALEAYGGEPLEGAECPLPMTRDRALYIYTSGTTGLPKAANVSHYRLMQWSHWFAGLANTTPTDRIYNCLPMYHSVGGIVAIGAALVTGGSVAIRPRFSARDFWEEIVRFDCTLFQYIGELCRYLLNSPHHPREREHRLRLCCGNGLRPDVWEPFKQRFAIPQILEFYAATEASFSLYNCEGKPGSIGRIPSFLAHRIRVALVKLDPDSGEPVRDGSGFCIRCAAEEPGEAISEIGDRTSGAGGRFEGYTDERASQKKVLTHVFAADDAWYRSGDLMRRDRAGFFYFVDRVGATFRWKGENVSATEVAETICGCPGVNHAVVFGVAIPNTDGRAGMAAIEATEAFDLGRLRQHLSERLPEYAHPVFVRILREIDTTGTFRPKTQDYAKTGYDPAATDDALYLNDRARQAFVRLDTTLFERIEAGDLRL